MFPHTPMMNHSFEADNGLLAAALHYLRRGWTIIPTKGKKAAGSWKQYQHRPPAEQTVRGWFTSPDVTGVAVILGRASGGLACRDFDTFEGHQDWARYHPDLAAQLPTVQTVRGVHVYFLAAEEGFKDFGDGEYRGDCGHYCLVPPSRHPSGLIYSWTNPPPDTLPLLDPVAAGLLSPNSAAQRGGAPAPHPPQHLPHVLCSPELSALSVLRGGGGEVEAIIRRTLPTGVGQRARKVFDLARELKSLPQLADADPADLLPVLREWHRLALPNIRTKAPEESEIDFIRAWDRVKHPVGTGPLASMLDQARRAPPPAAAMRYDQPEIRLLVGLVAELQRAAGDRPFFLSCRSAADLLRVHNGTVCRWLQLLVRSRVLKLVSKGDRAQKKASEYRYLPEL
jgi:hypothetical protein